MITSLIYFIVVALLALIVHIVVGMFIADGRVMKLIGIILGLLVLLYGLRLFHIALP